MRYSPSTRSVSLAKAFMLSLPCALARFLSNRLTSAGIALANGTGRTPSRRRVVRTRRRGWSSVRTRAIASRYGPHDPRRRHALPSSSNSRDRAAISKLAARRLTSHSNGPGLVSSKSLTSNTSVGRVRRSRRSCDRCASPQHLHAGDRVRGRREVGGHDHGGAPVERERRREHPLVADRDEFGTRVVSCPVSERDRVRSAGAAPTPREPTGERRRAPHARSSPAARDRDGRRPRRHLGSVCSTRCHEAIVRLAGDVVTRSG